ncbi:MAG: ferric reductase-like transmembrane domain-containing protein [Granulosicoccaceae bacterium]
MPFVPLIKKLYLPLFWGALAAPWFWIVWLWLSGDSTVHYLLHPSGKYSTRLFIVALAATPLRMLFPRSSWTRWLVQSRRHIGVAALAYALLHTVLYLIDEGVLWDIVAGVSKPSYLFGWLALAILLALGVTSNDTSVKSLGKRWKPLQRWVYVGAVLTFLHWVLLDFNVLMGVLHFAPLVLLQAYRLWRSGQQR